MADSRSAAPRLVERLPSVKEYLDLRRAAGWHALPAEAIQAGLEHSLYCLCLVAGERVVGCGRVVGDGGLYYYVQDLLVHPDRQGRGHGRAIMDGLMAYVRAQAPAGAFVGLMAAPGLDRFYAGYGFQRLPAEAPGMGLWI